MNILIDGYFLLEIGYETRKRKQHRRIREKARELFMLSISMKALRMASRYHSVLGHNEGTLFKCEIKNFSLDSFSHWIGFKLQRSFFPKNLKMKERREKKISINSGYSLSLCFHLLLLVFHSPFLVSQ